MANETSKLLKEFLTNHFHTHKDEISSSGPNLTLFQAEHDAVLLHDLDPDKDTPILQTNAYKYIEHTKQQGLGFLYGTSGAGKTRTIFEHLSRHKGFYFVSDDLERNPGSSDLQFILEVGGLKTTRPSNPADEDSEFNNQANRIKIKERISMLLFIRYAVHAFRIFE